MKQLSSFRINKLMYESLGSFSISGKVLTLVFDSSNSANELFKMYIREMKKVNQIEFYCQNGNSYFLGPFLVKTIKGGVVTLQRER